MTITTNFLRKLSPYFESKKSKQNTATVTVILADEDEELTLPFAGNELPQCNMGKTIQIKSSEIVRQVGDANRIEAGLKLLDIAQNVISIKRIASNTKQIAFHVKLTTSVFIR